MVDEVSKDKHISRWVDQDNLIYLRWNDIKNCIFKDKKEIKTEKRG